MDITVYGGGELIPALEGFDAVRNGAVEMNHGAAYYWAGKVPAAQFFCDGSFWYECAANERMDTGFWWARALGRTI